MNGYLRGTTPLLTFPLDAGFIVVLKPNQLRVTCPHREALTVREPYSRQIFKLKSSQTKRAERKEQFRKIGAAITAAKHVWDPNIGGTQAHPWRVVKGATGFYGMQLDTRVGLCVKEADEP